MSLNYAINQPLEKYNTVINGVEVGLYNTYKDRPALMAAVFLMTAAPFTYEATSTVPEPLRAGALDPIVEGWLSDTLISCIGGKMVLTLLEFLDPLQFYEYLEGFDLSHLPIRKFYDSDENLRLIIRARVGAWSKHGWFDTAKQQVINAVNGGV